MTTRKDLLSGTLMWLLFTLLAGALFFATTVTYVALHMQGSPTGLPADCAIIFGTAVRITYSPEGTVSTEAGPGIARRVGTAVDLYRQGRVKHLFFSGGKGDGNQTSEAQVMRGVALAMHVPAKDITVEDRSRSTWENLLFTRPLTAQCHGVVGISDGYHLARIALYAHVQGWELPTFPSEEQPDVLFTARNLLREATAIDVLVFQRLLT